MPSSGFQTCALISEEHTSELQSHDNLVCRLLLEKKCLQDGSQGRSSPAWLHVSEASPRRRARPSLAPLPPVLVPTPPQALAVGYFFSFFNNPAPPEISPFSLHDVLPI